MLAKVHVHQALTPVQSRIAELYEAWPIANLGENGEDAWVLWLCRICCICCLILRQHMEHPRQVFACIFLLVVLINRQRPNFAFH